jgi:hypothetical protein
MSHRKRETLLDRAGARRPAESAPDLHTMERWWVRERAGGGEVPDEAGDEGASLSSEFLCGGGGNSRRLSDRRYMGVNISRSALQYTRSVPLEEARPG